MATEQQAHRDGPSQPEDFVRAAAEIVRRDGLQSFTMRRLADEVGLSPMAVYRHFPSKADLFAAVIDRAWEEALGGVETEPEDDPREAIIRSLVLTRQRLVAQGELAVLIAGRPRITPILARLIEEGYRRLRLAGVPDPDVPAVQLIFARATAASAVYEAAAAMAARLSGRVDIVETPEDGTYAGQPSLHPAPHLEGPAQRSAEFERSIRLLVDAALRQYTRPATGSGT